LIGRYLSVTNPMDAALICRACYRDLFIQDRLRTHKLQIVINILNTTRFRRIRFHNPLLSKTYVIYKSQNIYLFTNYMPNAYYIPSLYMYIIHVAKDTGNVLVYRRGKKTLNFKLLGVRIRDVQIDLLVKR